MKLFLLLFLSFFFAQHAVASNFSQKKIIKIDQGEDQFKMIDLGQKVRSQKLDEQKALFDSSTLRTAGKDRQVDFGILIGFRENFGYVLDGVNIKARDFSSKFSQEFIKDLSLKLISSSANKMYQMEKTFNFFNPNGNFKLVDVSRFLKQESDTSFTDFIIMVSLDEFYVSITDFFFVVLKNAYAKINVKIIQANTGKIANAKNIDLRLRLDSRNPTQNYENLLSQMPQMLAEVVNEEGAKLKLE